MPCMIMNTLIGVLHVLVVFMEVRIYVEASVRVLEVSNTKTNA